MRDEEKTCTFQDTTGSGWGDTISAEHTGICCSLSSPPQDPNQWGLHHPVSEIFSRVFALFFARDAGEGKELQDLMKTCLK